MSVFQKTCFKCGKKTNKLYDSMCEDCFKEEFPPIKDLKEINVKYCNMCNNLNYNNQNLTPEEFEKKLPNIIKKNLILNKKYSLKEIKILNFTIKGDLIDFEFEIYCELK